PEQIYHQTIREAAQFQMPSALRQLFTIILLYGEPSDVRSLWNVSFIAMSEDFARNGIPDGYPRINA
ncbi:4660_t:CDS:1, partial [Gigaspora margarita]